MRGRGTLGRGGRKRLLIAAVILCVVVLGVIVWTNLRPAGDGTDGSAEGLRPGAVVSIGRVDHTATRDGRIEWKLDAESAHYLEGGRQVRLENLAVTFFLENGERVHLTAREGRLETGTNDMEVTGDVVMRMGEDRLTTETLTYRHADRVIFSRTPVRIHGPKLALSADGADFDLNTSRGTLEGNVHGIFEAKDIM